MVDMRERALLILMTIVFVAIPASAGVEWRQVGPVGSVTAIAAATNEPMLLTGTADGLLFRSIDRAQTWQQVGVGLGLGAVVQIAVDPNDAHQVWVGMDDGMFRSNDRGSTFAPLMGGSVLQFAVARSNPSVLYVALFTQGYILLVKSIDGGAIWDFPSRLHWFSAVAVAIDAIDPEIVYAVGSPFGSTPDIHGPSLWRSTDGGQSWTNTAVPGPVESVVAHPTRGGIAIATRDSGVAYRTTDGTTWTALNESGDGPIAFDPNVAGRVYLGLLRNEGGFYRSDDNGGSVRGLDNSRLARNLVVDPADSNTLYAGAQSGGVIRSDDAGQSWMTQNVQLSATEMNWLAKDPSNANVIYAGGSGAVFRTTDNGASWGVFLPLAGGTVATEPRGIGQLAVDPHDSKSVWATSGLALWHSSDTGASWQHVTDFPGEYASEGITNDGLKGLAMDPREANTIWVAASGNRLAGSQGEIYKSSDGGKTFTDLAPKLGYGDLFRQAIVDPVTPGRIWICGVHAYYKPLLLLSSDAGQTWTDLSLRLAGAGEVSALVVDPDRGSTIYVATLGYAGDPAQKLFESDDAGKSWQTSGSGLAAAVSAIDPMARVTSMIVQRGLLYAALGPPVGFQPPDEGGILVSADRGASWIDFSGAIGHRNVPQLLASNPVLAATVGQGVFAQSVSGRQRVVAH